MSRHEEYKEMLVPHALGALEPDEARSLEEHLEQCAECRDELDSWQETAATLAYAADAAEPRAELRARIIEQARKLPQSASNNSERQRDALEIGANKDSATRSNVIPMPIASRSAWSSAQRFGAIAASLIIAALAIALVIQWQRTNTMEAELARLSRQNNETQQELAQLRDENQFLASPNARLASLSGTEMAKDARARLAYDHNTGRAMLIADGLPPAPAGKAYQLWFIVEGKPPMPGGVFTTDAQGRAELHDQMPPEGRNAGIFAVTLERAGGVPPPEGKAFLQGKAS
ncbi:MAG: anti-sigma factor [Pyrinomonadaceae bacterium]|nr:anti-sigma factor [Pyrinomonadaceae bacterium]